MEDVRVRIGRVQAGPGEFSFSIVAKPSGQGYITVYASTTETDEPEQNVLGIFNLEAWNKLRAFIRETDATVLKMSASKQITSM